MKKLTNINITNEELKYMIHNRLISYGSEGIILKYTNDIAFKIFNNNMSQNKYEKIKLLYKINPKDMVNLISTISLNNNLIGYAMSYSKKDVPFNYINYPLEDITMYLKNIIDIIKYFESLNIIYGDIYDRNILINPKNGKITFCDIDNIMIDNYSFDIISNIIDNYIKIHGKIDNSIHAYTHNIMTINKIVYPNNSSFNRSDILEMLLSDSDNIIDKLCKRSFNPQDYVRVRKITKSMIYPKNFKGEYIIK